MRKMKSIKPRNTYREGGDKWSNLDSILLRGGTQVDDTDFTLQVFGVFALPELYSKLYQSGSVDAWTYSRSESRRRQNSRRIKTKEEKEKAFNEILSKMTEEEKYYYLKELPTKEPWLSWPEGKSIAKIKKSGDNLFLHQIKILKSV